MKIAGLDPKTLPNEETLVIPRGDAMVVFRARGLANMDDFEKLCPEPKPPGKLTRDGYVPDTNDDNFKKSATEYGKRRFAYLIVKSLEPSEIEWDTVDINNPGTWANWETDMKTNSFTAVECNLVMNLVMGANSLDENKLRKAREVFQLGPPKA